MMAEVSYPAAAPGTVGSGSVDQRRQGGRRNPATSGGERPAADAWKPL